MSEASLLCDPFYVSIDDFAVLMSNHIDHIYIYKRPLPCVSEEMSSKAAFSGRFILTPVTLEPPNVLVCENVSVKITLSTKPVLA